MNKCTRCIGFKKYRCTILGECNFVMEDEVTECLFFDVGD